MGYTVEEEVVIPAGYRGKARLEKVEEKTINWDDKQGEKKSAQIIEWGWKFTEGTYQGEWINGSCPAKLTNAEHNRFRQIAEALLQMELTPGQDVSLEDFVGLSAVVTVRHRPGKNGKGSFPEVDEVFSLADAKHGDDVPF